MLNESRSDSPPETFSRILGLKDRWELVWFCVVWHFENPLQII
jgi:hypothetical protein